MDPIEEVKSEIAEVKEQIKAVSAEIKEAKEGIKRAEEAGNLSEKQRWVKEEEQLQEKENELLKEKNKLLDKEARLESAGSETKPSAPPSTREQVASIFRTKLPSPSSYAKNSASNGWPDPRHKALLKMLRTHRPATLADETFEQLPVGLLSPILAQVEEDCAYADPLAEDTDFAVMLSEEMSGTFADEDSRREKFCDMLSKEFFMPLNRATVGLGVTDGTAMLPVGVASAMAVNTEIKLEVGQGGGDPRLQNATYAAHNASLQYGSLGRVSYCPALLIELAGPNMSLSGFALGQYACCDQLSQMVSLLRQPKSEIAIGAARAIFAIRRAWPALQEYYQKLAETLKDYWRQSETPMPNQQLEFPYPNLFKPDGGDSTQSLRYLKRLTTYTFEAESMSKKVFVKYCKRYSREAHLVVQEAGHAPRLLCVQLLPGRWVMVVMEYLETAVTWSDSMVKPIEQLTAAVRVMHDAGFVHGDLRSPNVLVQDEKVHLVDFEWAGKEGHVSYPLFMNRATEMWPEGATDGQFIRKTHDAEWVRRLRAGDG